MKKQRLYIIRKYVMASSVKEAVKIESKFPVEECFVEDTYFKKELDQRFSENNPPLGFVK